MPFNYIWMIFYGYKKKSLFMQTNCNKNKLLGITVINIY